MQLSICPIFIYCFFIKGITLKLLNNKLVIARILHGGLIHRQGNRTMNIVKTCHHF